MQEGVEARGSDPLELENWIHQLEDLTFPTRFVGLSVEEAQALVDQYNGKATCVDALLGLTARLAVLIGAEGAFVRLSTRSPKDFALRAERTRRIFLEEQQRLAADMVNESQDTLDVICIIRAMSRALRVANAAEAVEMLSHSERSYQDLTRRLLNWEPINVVIRQWDLRLLPECELRAFVFRKKLTCVSQYYKACYAPLLSSSREKVARACHAMFQKMRDRIEPESYILDLAYLPESESCILVELNHWSHTTSSAMFDWKADIEVLENGPFTLRIQASAIPNVRALIATPLRAMAGWPPVVSQRNRQHEGALPQPAIAASKSSFRSSLAFKKAIRNFAACSLNDEVATSMKSSLLVVANRREPRPYWTYQDVSIIAPGKHVRPPEDAPLTLEHNAVPSLFICLFLRLTGVKDNKPLKMCLERCESELARVFGESLENEIGNALLALKELKLITRQ